MSKNVEGYSSPERASLAAANAKLAEALAEAQARATALDGLQAKTWDLMADIEKAEKAVDAAKADAAAYLVAKARGAVGPPPQTVVQARAKLQELQDELEATKSARELLTAEQQTPPMSANPAFLREDVRRAALAVLASSPALLALHQEVRDAWDLLKAKGAILLACRKHNLTPADFQRGASAGEHYETWLKAIEAARVEPDYQGAAPWSDVLLALCADANAPLPEPPSPPPGKAAESSRGVLAQFRGKKAG